MPFHSYATYASPFFFFFFAKSEMNVIDAHRFLKNRLDNGIGSAAALSQFSSLIEGDLETYRAGCPNLFPLSHQRRRDVMYRLVALVQEIDTNLSLFQFRPDCPFAPSEEPSEPEYMDATSYFLVPVPGASLPITDALIEPPNEAPKGRGVKRSIDDVPIIAGAAFESLDVEAAASQSTPTSHHLMLNLPHRPLSDSMLTACIATWIGDAPQLCLNDTVEVFGFLRDEESGEHNDDDTEEVWGWNALELPHGLVARLTAVSIRRFVPMHRAMSEEVVRELRQHALASLSDVCAGDALAAEYLLLSLIASVVRRHDDIPIGDVPLYLQYPQLSTDFFSKATQTLRSVVPVACVELSLKSDGDRLTPRMDHQRNILVSGALQVAAGTTVLVNPHGAPPSESLNERMLELIHRQAMKVDYVYSTARVVTSTHVIVAAECPPTDFDIPAIHVSCVVKVLPGTSSSPLTDDHHASIRSYLEMSRAQLEHLRNEDDGLASRMANEMAEAAQRHPTRFNRDALIHNNTFSAIAALTRARAASFGSPTPRYEDFAAVMALEASRCDRIIP
jgi:hypothetical protein